MVASWILTPLSITWVFASVYTILVTSSIKNSQGRRGWPLALFLAPGLFVITCLWYALRVVRGDPAYSVVVDKPNIRMYIGAFPKRLPQDVTHVVDVSNEFERAACITENIKYWCISTCDDEVPSTTKLHLIANELLIDPAQRRVVFVHCLYGRGRSAFAASLLMSFLNLYTSAFKALQHIQINRPCVQLSQQQKRKYMYF